MPTPKPPKGKKGATAGKKKAGKLMMKLSSPKLRKQQEGYVQMNAWIVVLAKKITATLETDPPNIPYPEPWSVGAAVDVGSKPPPKSWKRVRTKMLLNELGIPIGAHKEWLVGWYETLPNISQVKCTRLPSKTSAPDAGALPNPAGASAAGGAGGAPSDSDDDDDEWAELEE